MTSIERDILHAICNLGNNAYGVTIREEADCSIGRVYVTLDTLEGRGLIVSTVGDATLARGGRRKRMVRLTDEGTRALNAPPDLLLAPA